MSVFHKFKYKENSSGSELTSAEKFAVYYHNIFEYPLSFSELVCWTPKYTGQCNIKVENKNDYYFLSGREGLIYKRLIRQRFSNKKMELAKKASKVISIISGIRMVGITGSLAMNNASKNSDIDLLIITKKGMLWRTRLITYILLKILNYPIRVPGNKREKDHLCLNMWMDESNLEWGRSNRNYYTAHEILQTVPILDRGDVYNNFLSKNRWVLNFWPNVIEIGKTKIKETPTTIDKINWLENICYKIQLSYMRGKITNEVIKSTRAMFHPKNLSDLVIRKLEE